MHGRIQGVRSSDVKPVILANANEIYRLHQRVKETFRSRDVTPAARQAWQEACAEFQTRYDMLAFPGGYETTKALERIVAGDPGTVEAAICFLEVRPYFFRSGYMFKDILRKLKGAPLSTKQTARLEVVRSRLDEWRRKQSRS